MRPAQILADLAPAEPRTAVLATSVPHATTRRHCLIELTSCEHRTNRLTLNSCHEKAIARFCSTHLNISHYKPALYTHFPNERACS